MRLLAVVLISVIYVLSTYGQVLETTESGSKTDCLTADKPPQEQLGDLTKKAETQIRIFFETIKELGMNEKSPEMKQRYINNTIKTFTNDGIVEERSKLAKEGVTRPVQEYLSRIKARGENNRLLINYEITDPLLPREITCTEVNGQVFLSGKMTIRQYYCRMKYNAKPSDDFDFNTHCDYWDITDKEITVEMKLMKSVYGVNWVTLIKSVVVLFVK